MSAAHRFTTLDGMRGIAAIAVMFHHLTQHTSLSMFSNAPLAVDLFFCLSGFVIAFSYIDRLRESMSFREFVFRRLIRLYPMYFVGLLLGGGGLLWKFFEGQTSLTLNQLISAVSLNAFYLPYVSDFYVTVAGEKIPSPIFPTNDPAWSLFFEFVVNLVFGMFMFRTRKSTVLAFVFLGALGLILYCGLTATGSPGWGADNVLGGIPRTAFGFFSGVFIFLIFDTYRYRIRAIRPGLVIGLLILLMFDYRSGYFWLGSVLLVVPLLVVVGSISKPVNSSTARIFDYLGWISYPVYCLHVPIYSVFTLLTANSLGIWGSVVCIPIVVLISHLVAKYVEEPVRYVLSARFLMRKNMRDLSPTACRARS